MTSDLLSSLVEKSKKKKRMKREQNHNQKEITNLQPNQIRHNTKIPSPSQLQTTLYTISQTHLKHHNNKRN